MEENSKPKKIALYPFEGQFESKGQIYLLKIYKLNSQGMIAEISELSLSPHNTGIIKFKLPVDEHLMTLEAVVVKIHSQFVGAKNPKKKHFVEIHFKKLTSRNETIISDFMSRIDAKIKLAQQDQAKKQQLKTQPFKKAK